MNENLIKKKSLDLLQMRVVRVFAMPFIVMLIAMNSLYAQNSSAVSGSVKDENGAAMPGVSISVKGTSKGVSTKDNGTFSIDAAANDVLVFNFFGYKTQEVAVKGGKTLSIILNPLAQSLNEVVVVGYGTIKKRESIGSISKITAENISLAKSQNFVDALQGKASGVSISNSSGTPGAPVQIRIRGVNSINSGKDPLWIIDGVAILSSPIGKNTNAVAQSPMASINPSDIQSVEILKDAAATAIYGSRGSNGVIIVTTKSGVKGKGNVSVDYNTGVSNLTTSISDMGLANTAEWIQIVDKARLNGGLPAWQPGVTLTGSNVTTVITRDQALATNSDWASLALRQGSFKDLNASVSQGSDKSVLFASLNYRNDKGINVGNDLDRISGRVNFEATPFKNFTAGTRMNLSYLNNYRTKDGSSNPGGSGGAVGGFAAVAKAGLPWFPIYDENNASGYWNPAAGNLALASRRDLVLDKREQYRGLGNIYAEYAIPMVQGLSLRAEGGYDLIQDNGTNWVSRLIPVNGQASAYEGAITQRSLNYNALIKYNRAFGEIHSFNVVVGTESQKNSMYTRELAGSNLVGYNQEIGSANPGTISQANSYLNGERNLLSYFARANYTLLNRYILNTSIRQDGSSAFNKNVRWGTFGAVGAGWIISDETFFKPLNNVVNLLKLRGSFGQTGNQSIPNNSNLTLLNNNSGDRYGPSSNLSAGTTYSVGNEAITWEKTNSSDVGFDFGLFNDRISGSVAYYLKRTKDMLLQVTTPPSAGINNVYSNVGDLDNWGYEFNLTSNNINHGSFKWSTDFNFSTNKNKITRLTPEMERQKGATLFVGGSLDLQKMANYAGIDPERGVHMIYEYDMTKFNQTGEIAYTGRKIPATSTNAGLYQVVFTDKSKIPTYFGGVNNSFSYKGFDLNVFFTFSGGNWIYNDYERTVTNVSTAYWNLKSDLLTDSWEPGKTDAKYPRLFFEGGAPPVTAWDVNAIDPNTGLKGYWKNPDINNVTSTAKESYDKNGGSRLSKNLEKGDYIRLRTLALGYNLPKKFASKIYTQNIRINFTANNLWTSTKYTGFDPEVGETAFTPATRNYSFGLGITF